MGSIVEVILSNIMQLMPFRILMSYELGVRWTFGKNPQPLAPGFHWCFWVLHHIEQVLATEEVLNLPTQSVMTKDGKTVCFSANIGRVITDPVKYFCNVTDFPASTEGLAMTHLAKRVREQDLEKSVTNLGALEKSLSNTLSTKFEKWGAEVTTVGFTDFVVTRHQIRMFGDPRIQPTHQH